EVQIQILPLRTLIHGRTPTLATVHAVNGGSCVRNPLHGPVNTTAEVGCAEAEVFICPRMTPTRVPVRLVIVIPSDSTNKHWPTAGAGTLACADADTLVNTIDVAVFVTAPLS